MALLKELKGSFVGGQVSPELQNRIDLEKFNTFLKEAKNTKIKPEGGISNRAGTVFIGNSKEATLRLTINVNVSATIIINGVEYSSVTTKSVDLDIGSEYTYSVSAEGYDEKSGSGTIMGNTVIDIKLEEDVNNYTFEISNSQGATITINGVEQSSITAPAGTLIEWEVSKTGYITQSGSFLLSSDTETPKVVTLEEATNLYLTITAYPSNSTISLLVNGTDAYIRQSSVTVSVRSGDTYTYKIECNDYTTENGSGTIANEDVNVTVTLQRTSYSVSNITTQDLVSGVTSLFRYNINKSGQYSFDIKGETGVRIYNGNNDYGDGWHYSATGKGGTATGTLNLVAGQEIEFKVMKGGIESFTYNGTSYVYMGGCGIGVWIDNVLALVVGGGALWTSDYYDFGYQMGGGGYNGGNATFNNTRREEYCGFSYNGLRGNNTTENDGSGGKAQTAYGGSGYVKSEYSSYFTLTKNTNQAKASASITFVG